MIHAAVGSDWKRSPRKLWHAGNTLGSEVWSFVRMALFAFLYAVVRSPTVTTPVITGRTATTSSSLRAAASAVTIVSANGVVEAAGITSTFTSWIASCPIASQSVPEHRSCDLR